MLRLLTTSLIAVLIFEANADEPASNQPSDFASLPGHIDELAGTLNSIEVPLEEGPECRNYRISVPENRAAESSRNIRLYFYRLKARTPSGRAPVFFLPGGPGGFYNDDWVKGLNSEPSRGSNLEAWRYLENRDVVLVNQRGARLPDKTFQMLFFIAAGDSLAKPYDYESSAASITENAKVGIDQWESRGMDLAGYDIMNMVEDINDIRIKLGYKKIALRGTSFGSQWSMAYMQKYPQHVDRAVLGGTEPIDHGWDSPQGIWNVMGRLEKHLEENPSRPQLGFPDVPLTNAIRTIIKRLETEPVIAKVDSQEIPIGVQDFQRCLLRGIGAHKERRESFANMPKFIYEVFEGDYAFLAAQVRQQRPATQGVPLQLVLIDNSLGISKAREAKLDREPGRRWIGELNAIYKATRDVTPTPVVDDSFRELKTDIPLLLVHGDFDLSTPIENAEELLASSQNAHMIRIAGGTHGAFDQIAGHDPDFLSVITDFLNADLEAGDGTIKSLGLPSDFTLPPLEFAKASGVASE